ncbi:MAG: MMPL family transporter [Deltaproteobacteria bacterium]|nr:MMPL family transporter [Deltaproteobacteria bacterium]
MDSTTILRNCPNRTALPPQPRKYLTDEENSRVVNAVKQTLEKYKQSDFPVYIAGSPVVTHFLKQSMMKDMRKFEGLAVLTVAVLLLRLCLPNQQKEQLYRRCAR